METMSSTSEIVEAREEFNAKSGVNEKVRKNFMSRQGRVYSIEDDINRLFDSVSIKTAVKAEALQRNPMKRPIRANYSPVSGNGSSDSVNLKQALRGLCISQASELAAMKKRSLKPGGSSGISDVGARNQLHKTVVIGDEQSSLSVNRGKRNLLDISFPGKIMANLSEALPESVEVSSSASSNHISHPSTASVGTMSTKVDKVVPLPSEAMSGKSSALEVNDLVSTREDAPSESAHLDKSQTSVLKLATFPASRGVDSKVKDARSGSPRLRIPVLLRRNFDKGKAKMESDSTQYTSHAAEGIVDTNLSSRPKTDKLVNKASKGLSKHEGKTKGKTFAASSGEIPENETSSRVPDVGQNQLFGSKVKDGASTMMVAKLNERLRAREKGEFSQSSKSSMGEYSSSTSEESSASGSSRSCSRPHMSKDMRWKAIHLVQKQYGFLSLRHFKLLKRLGSGDIGTVYLAELASSNCLFALKVMDNEFLARRKKLVRAQTEREILQMLDHPFLPTLYTHFTTDKLSCLVMDYCPGGDLHVIRQRQTSRCFPEQAARFYVAEVLLALEYLHMLGIVYRDLKPENVLVREDGHIMLTDFDLSLRCVVNPTLLRSSSPTIEPPKKISSSFCSESSCIDPFCLQPSWQVSCFTPRLLTATSKTRKLKSDQASQISPLPQLVAEPTDARSNSFVGTHEYLAPEIVKGEGHGSAVDWWTYGIFLYELLYGKTPFKGSSNEETLANVLSQPLRFPETPLVSFHAKDLIRGLLIKQPENRMGFVKGAAEIKQHPFFEGLNWALIRCAVPPERPGFRDVGLGPSSSTKDKNQSIRVDSSEHIEFELF